MRKFLILLSLIALFSQSCKVFRSNLMLKTKNDFKYDQLVDSLTRVDYKIAANDVLNYRIFTNEGFKLIDLANTNNLVSQNNIDVMVDGDGTVKMPMVGFVKLEGLTIREAEKLLEEKFSEYYVKPFVTVRVTNKRVIVFPGNGGVARVLSVSNNNTTVMEVLAMAGGITEDGKAYKVKLIRKIDDQVKVYLMDLSKIEGIKAGSTRILANDIIYVEPRYRLARTLANELMPVVTLISTTLIIYSLFIKK